MRFLTNLLGGPVVGASADTSGTANPEGWLVDLLGGVVTATGIRVSARDAMTVPGVAACVQVLSEDLAKVPLILYRRKRGGGRERADTHPLYKRLKERPAPWLTSFAWRRALVEAAMVHGNGYSRVRRDNFGVQVQRLTLLPSGRVQPRWAQDGEPFFDVSVAGNNERALSFRDVIHVPYRATMDGAENGGIIGISPLHQHRETIALAIVTERFAAKFFANGARPSAVLEYDKILPNDGVATRMRNGIERLYSGVDNAFRIALLELGVKFREISSNNSDSQLIEVRKHQAELVAQMFNMPPHKIGILDRATNNNIEHQGIDYVKGPVSSLAKCIESAITTACLSDAEQEEFYLEHNLDGLMRGDLLSRYRAYAIGRNWGWLSADDVRDWENMDPLPDGQGKIYLIPGNMNKADDPANDNGGDAKPAN
ncbi:phage portal protein [Magnetospirillum aberrantis]|uniref:Phage portal protein n=1 Tax=Magnetospirillum aberrantis SpK TaxID=908842 RepID=A0A7C9UTD5_9PROT|nr:phage portal protein [Magnetospirillum aberrantis]NFV80007.1 phage portal protein [Magnetospirillum aberrantis SpK]